VTRRGYFSNSGATTEPSTYVLVAAGGRCVVHFPLPFAAKEGLRAPHPTRPVVDRIRYCRRPPLSNRETCQRRASIPCQRGKVAICGRRLSEGNEVEEQHHRSQHPQNQRTRWACRHRSPELWCCRA